MTVSVNINLSILDNTLTGLMELIAKMRGNGYTWVGVVDDPTKTPITETGRHPFFEQLDFTSYPEFSVFEDCHHHYDITFLRLGKYCRALIFVLLDGHKESMSHLYLELDWARTLTFGKAVFYMPGIIELTNKNARILYQQKIEDELTLSVSTLFTREHTEFFLNYYNKYRTKATDTMSLVRRNGNEQLVLIGALQLSEVILKTTSQCYIEKLMRMLRTMYRVGWEDFKVRLVSLRSPQYLTTNIGDKSITYQIKTGYILFYVDPKTGYNNGEGLSNIQFDITEVEKMFKTEFLTTHRCINICGASDHPLRLMLNKDLTEEKPNFFNAPDDEHQDEKGERNIGLESLTPQQLGVIYHSLNNRVDAEKMISNYLSIPREKKLNIKDARNKYDTRTSYTDRNPNANRIGKKN